MAPSRAHISVTSANDLILFINATETLLLQ